MSLGAIYGSRKDIKTINHIEYKVVRGPSNTETKVAVTLNKHILLGVFSTSLMAIEAVEGSLVKVGSNNPRLRRIKLTVDKHAVFTGADFVPNTGNPINWANSLVTLKGTSSWPNTRNSSAMAGCNVPLLVRLEISGNSDVWYKNKTVSTGETSGNPSTTGYTKAANNELVYIPMGQFLFFKTDSDLVTVTATTPASGTLRIYNAYTEDLLDTVQLTTRWAL